MSNSNQNSIDKNNNSVKDVFSFENIWKISFLLFMIASLYLQNNFVNRNDFILTEKRIKDIELVISQLEYKSRIDEQQTKTLELIEARLRNLEQQTAILMNLINRSDKK
jgi:hypothetical protein